MAWWKAGLLFVCGVVVGAVAWAVSDLAILSVSNETDLSAAEADGTELYDATVYAQ